MNQTSAGPIEEWLKVLGKGMVTIPKKWREELGIHEGDRIKATKEGKRVVIESPQEQAASYRVYSDEEIDEFVRDDVLTDPLATQVAIDLSQRGRP
ncbi:MAG: AbrB/MazE/SpoVT family DNA-binding domain-containing protein [Patescibacteria group bacterium]